MTKVWYKFINEIVDSVLVELTKFNPNSLDDIPNLVQKVDVARESGLREMGSGSSRTAFVLDSKRALKIAFNDAGVSQNETEIRISKIPQANNILTRIYKSAANGSWIVTDLVRPLTSPDEFSQLTGFPFTTFAEFLYTFDSKAPSPNLPSGNRNVPDTLKVLRWKADRMKQKLPKYADVHETNYQKSVAFAMSPFFKSILALLQSELGSKLKLGDITVLGHWGKTADGRLVLLDYGFTEEVQQQHY